MEKSEEGNGHTLADHRDEGRRKRLLIAFFAVLAGWLLLDQLTKMAVAGFEPGDVIYGSRAGLFDLVMVHNTGGAWGMFSGATAFLGALSVAVSAGIILFAVRFAQGLNLLGSVSLGLIAAGGLGNAIDRFTQGYVTDFISTAFMDFPVFNVADIGVTVGIALLFISLLISSRREGHGTGDQR